MHPKGTRKGITPSRKRAPWPQGRPHSDKPLQDMFTELERHSERLTTLLQQRAEMADWPDAKGLQYNHRLISEASDNFWNVIDKITAQPAHRLIGLRVKADALLLIESRSDTEPVASDSVVADVENRLAISLADDIRRWHGRRP
jgi:hypothetical protein